mgnify:CR=1 FL=1
MCVERAITFIVLTVFTVANTLMVTFELVSRVRQISFASCASASQSNLPGGCRRDMNGHDRTSGVELLIDWLLTFPSNVGVGCRPRSFTELVPRTQIRSSLEFTMLWSTTKQSTNWGYRLHSDSRWKSFNRRSLNRGWTVLVRLPTQR